MTALSHLLRATLAADHLEIEQTSVARAMLDGSIARARYRTLLAQLLPVHVACDAAVQALMIPDLAQASQRSEAVRADLAFFGSDEVTPIHPAAVAFATRLAALSATAVLGVAYVVAGSRMGSRVLDPLLRQGLQLADSAGLAYHQTPPHYPVEWRRMLSQLDAIELTGPERDQVTEAAAFGMRTLLAIFKDA